MKILIISQCPTHPTNAGNRWGVLAQANTLRMLGQEVHFLYVYEPPLRRDIRPYLEELDMTREYWADNFHLYKVTRIEKWRTTLLQEYRRKCCQGFLHCDDRYPSGLTKCVERLNQQYGFDICIVNYYYLTKLYDRCNIPKKALFTHDCYAYKSLAVDEKAIQLKPNEEAKAMQRSPHIFGVQDDECAYFQMLSPKSKVYNIYSKYQYHASAPVGNHNVLFLSGNNKYNINGLQWFVKNIFPEVLSVYPDAKLIIAGAICKKVPYYTEHPNIVLMGYVDNPEKLYSQGDVAINPVYQGTGLKIKTFEAVSYDKVTLVHPHSLKGVFARERAPLFASSDAGEWVEQLKEVWNDMEVIAQWKERNKLYMEKLDEFVTNQYKLFLRE